jgi:sortase A
LLIAVGAALVLAAVGWQVNATVWSAHAESVGHRLIRQVRAERAASGAVTCTVAPDAPQGLLQAPSIGLVAPVEQGTGDAVLSVAVGHDPSSVWPGASGNAVLEAHDVSYFVDIDQLRTGDTVDYATPCATYVFAVQGHQVVDQGSPVYDTATPTLTMVTCWPTDALWFTPDRYVVTATEVRVQRSTPRTLSVPAGTGSSSAPSVAAPPALVAEGLTLTSYSVPMGTMTIRGTPSPAWVESPAPLADQQAAVEAFIGGVRAAVQDQTAWWADIAPGVQIPEPLLGAQSPSYLSALDVTVTAVGSHATAVRLTTTVAVTGGSAPGRYAMTVDDTIAGHRLRIAAWVLWAM